MDVELRDYDSGRDREACYRIWRECGWLEPGKEANVDLWFDASRGHVATIDGEAECLVLTSPGTIRYLNQDLSFSGVTGVTTSRIARKQGLAARLLARALAADAAEGLLVAGLGMFEQGFYNQVGFGTGPYEIHYAFDPAHVQVAVRPRIPCRFGLDDWEALHQARLNRRRPHGAINLTHPQLTRTDMAESTNGFGLGYRDAATGEVTHFLWFSPKEVEQGPYKIKWSAWRTREEFLELMALLRTLGDQVHLVAIDEPAEIQLQDLVRQPLKHRRVTKRSDFEGTLFTAAWYQYRILDLPGCLEKTRLTGPTLRFNLRLTDPVEQYLEPASLWRGVGGSYTVTLGPESSARPGETEGLPALTATVNAFTRLWLGVRPARGLAITDDLDGPPELLQQMEDTLRLHVPRQDWDF